MPGKLLIVGTPLGNLGDMPPRAVDALKSADTILCEDTRHSRKLLTHFGIDKPLERFDDHTEDARAEMFAGRIERGDVIALISDAGMPVVSDPGFRLVQVARARGLDVEPIPGPFAGILALDKWTCNADGRQAAFWRKTREKKYTATFIDQGYCFNAGEWSFPDSPLRGVFMRNDVYVGVTGWGSFEPWLTCLEEMPVDEIARCAEDIPPEWYENDQEGLNLLIEALDHRRKRIRRLIEEFRDSTRTPFPNWRGVGDEPQRLGVWMSGSPEENRRRWN